VASGLEAAGAALIRQRSPGANGEGGSMPRITNARGDFIDVECGGFNGDNVLGTVEEVSSGGASVPVGGAKMVVSNMSQAGEVAEADTNGAGTFDVDVDAACGNLIYVSATWKDTNKRVHVVKGSFRCPPCEKDQARAKPRKPEERLARIDRMEERLVGLIAEQTARQGLIAAIQAQMADDVIADLNALGDLERKAQQAAIDERLQKEIIKLLEKIAMARESGTPPTDRIMDMIEEIVLLQLKLFAKMSWLQEQRLPEYPRPGGGGTA
jgi:hypothetical protein